MQRGPERGAESPRRRWCVGLAHGPPASNPPPALRLPSLVPPPHADASPARRSPGLSPRAVAVVPAVVTGSSPGRCQRSRSGSGAALNSPPAPGGGHRGRAPGDAGDPHVGAVPAAAMVPSSPPAPGGGHRVRPRAMPAIRTSAAPAVRLAIDAGPHGPGRGHRVRPRATPAIRTSARPRPRPRSRARRRCRSVRPRAVATRFDPGRSRRFARRRDPGRGHRVRPRAMPAIRTSAAPAVRLAIDAGPHGSGRGHRVRPRATPAIRTSARSRPRPRTRARRRCRSVRPRAVATRFDPGRCRRSRVRLAPVTTRWRPSARSAIRVVTGGRSGIRASRGTENPKCWRRAGFVTGGFAAAVVWPESAGRARCSTVRGKHRREGP